MNDPVDFSPGASINFQGGTSPYALTLDNVESFINEFSNKYICIYSLA